MILDILFAVKLWLKKNNKERPSKQKPFDILVLETKYCCSLWMVASAVNRWKVIIPAKYFFRYMLNTKTGRIRCWWPIRYRYRAVTADQAPVPLSIFRSNSKFDENSERSSFKYIRPITTIFCTRHDSDTVVTCAKYRCDRPRIFYTRVFWIFIEFRIRSKYA